MNRIVDVIANMYSHKKYFIMGYNQGWKQHLNLGKNTNRKFHDIPFLRLVKKLRTRLEKEGKVLIITEESYTSITDALILENFHTKKEDRSGDRSKRGLFISGNGKAINADINGAINIMRKVYDLKKITGINLYCPIKITL